MNERTHINYILLQPSVEILSSRPFEVKFLIDTGTTITVLNEADIHVISLFNDILSPIFTTEGSPLIGVSGLPIPTIEISPASISFNSSVGKHRESILNLTISPINNQDKRPERQYSILGIDILQRFDILFDGKYAYLRKK